MLTPLPPYQGIFPPLFVKNVFIIAELDKHNEF